MKEPTASLSGLRSQRSSQRLEEIANLRSRRIGEHVGLAQLVVCVDQSAGKSSVLEGITGLLFPRQDGIRTRFATEIMLIHIEGQMYMLTEIIPSQFRTEFIKDELAAYKRTIADISELSTVITEAGTLMGVCGSEDIDRKCVALDTRKNHLRLFSIFLVNDLTQATLCKDSSPYSSTSYSSLRPQPCPKLSMTAKQRWHLSGDDALASTAKNQVRGQ